MPTISQADCIRGNRLVLRNVLESDAEFILRLRLDPSKSRYISPVENSLGKQVEWIENYRRGVGEAYFIIESDEGPQGTVRLYDANGNSFSWGSWIVRAGAPSSIAIESALIVYRFALTFLGFGEAHFNVDRENISVLSFHDRFGATRVGVDERQIFFHIGFSAIEKSMIRYRRFLPNGISVSGGGL